MPTACGHPSAHQESIPLLFLQVLQLLLSLQRRRSAPRLATRAVAAGAATAAASWPLGPLLANLPPAGKHAAAPGAGAPGASAAKTAAGDTCPS